MSDLDPCELCGMPAETVAPSGGYDGIRQRCPRCGDFKLARTAMIRRASPDDKVKLSGWVRDQNQLEEVPELTSDRISIIAVSRLPGIVERADRLLSHAIKCQSRLGERFRMGSPELLAVTYSQDGHEVEYLARFLKERPDQLLLIQEVTFKSLPAVTCATKLSRVNHLHRLRALSQCGSTTRCGRHTLKVLR
jgi:hypothetical protein